MIEYRIVHQLPGRIKIHLPLIKGISFNTLQMLAEKLSAILEIPPGIKKIKPNPITGNVVIEYDPAKIDILSFIKELQSKLCHINIADIKANTNQCLRKP